MVIIIVLHQSEWNFYTPHLLPSMLCDNILPRIVWDGFQFDDEMKMASQCNVKLLVGGRYMGKGGPEEPGGEETKENS